MFERFKQELIDRICQVSGISEINDMKQAELARLAIGMTLDRRYPHNQATWEEVAGDLIEFYFPYEEAGSAAILPTKKAINSR